MAGLEFNMGRMGARGKGVSVAVAVLAVALFLVDFVLLRGEHVAHAEVYFDRSEPARIAVDRVGERHLVEISTRKRIRGETRGRRVAYRLEDPSGQVLERGSEMALAVGASDGLIEGVLVRDSRPLADGTLGARARRRLQRSEHFEDLLLLDQCDRAGRQVGVEAPELDEALDYLRELGTMFG